jgi:hypothetical protein
VETVAGEITPGAIATPIAPDTGNGFGTPAGGLGWWLLLVGIGAISLGAGVVAIARRS